MLAFPMGVYEKLMEKFTQQLSVKEHVKLVAGKIIEECGMAISLLHRGNIEEARRLLTNVKRRVKRLTRICLENPTVFRLSIVRDAKMEYVEAAAFYHYLVEGKIPNHEFFGVEPEEYVLGLADLVGELRRRCLDLIRMGKLESASQTFEQMVETHQFVWRFEYPKKLVRGLRHKIDVNRKLLEDTRLILTQAHILAKGDRVW